ncbi:hypothetical protein E4U43_006372 [Claviceps pusilla]|uniref:ML-like domain-containing protein n=1 Tax=Claviceps pusilla TaxID=123648 RepID=A0A9P7NG79_9HYPO|nr:hypothetical protein E4U43_006372 [Claviceps pusilla]
MAGKLDFGTIPSERLFSSSFQAPSPISTTEYRGDPFRRNFLQISNPSFSHHDTPCQPSGTNSVCATSSSGPKRQTMCNNRSRHASSIVSAASGTMRRLMTVALFSLLASTPVSAVRIRPTNCLPESFQNQNPPFIQWVPVEAHAKFDTKSNKHNFQYIVWGNVTGSLQRVKLPPPEDRDYWTNPDKTNGKIINSDNSENGTTVKSSISMLSYVPWSHRYFFCGDALVNGSCPLPPVFNTTGNVSLYDLPSMNITNDMYSSYSFASFAATILIIFGNAEGTNIGCVSSVITPDLQSLAWVLKVVPLIVLLFSGFAVVFAGIFSPWGSSNIFHWSSNYGRDADLLRLVTPGFGDCLQYLQFIALSGALSLNYPGFFQPVVSQVAWSTLMFNQSFVTQSPGWQSVQDGIYVTDISDGYGLHALGQLTGMQESADIWAGMMVWLCVIIVGVFVLTQAGFSVQWLYRKVRNIPEEDLRAKNLPFSTGNVIRIVFNFLMIPIVALSCFQLAAAGDSPAYAIGLAAITLALLLGFAIYVLLLIIRTRPKSCLFDDLPTVLRYGPLYNTYSDEAAAFALIPVLLNFVRGVAIGAVQASGISQIVLLAICEVIQIFTLHAFKPFQSPTSMNAYHTLFCVLRLISVLLMVAFAPSLGVTEGPKGWIGYAIMLIHGGVLGLAFFLNALQTTVEVVARLLGAGGDHVGGLTRGGLTKIFGMRELSRRETHRTVPSRASQLSTMAMLHAEAGGKMGYLGPSNGRLRSTSTVDYGGTAAVHVKHRSSSGLQSIDMFSAGHRHADSNSSYIPGTPGETSTFSFVASPTVGRPMMVPVHAEPSDPYYRPPRRSAINPQLTDSTHSDAAPNALGIDAASAANANSGATGEATEPALEETSRGATPAPLGGAGGGGGGGGVVNLPVNHTDYATREVDFYYGVRGPALNSDNPGRRLGTGPADPTGPVATATGWFRNWFSGKSKEKGKGFEVVRSSRMPPDMVRNGGFGDETPPEGIPVAMGVLRNGPIDSDDDEVDHAGDNDHDSDHDNDHDNEDEDDEDNDASSVHCPPSKSSLRKHDDLLSDNDESQEDSDDDDAGSPTEDGARPNLPRGRTIAVGRDDLIRLDLPEIPRKSSKRNSGSMDPRRMSALSALDSPSPVPSDRLPHDIGDEGSSGSREKHLSVVSALPFERTASQNRSSSKSSLDFPGELTEVDLRGGGDEGRPASYGTVPQHGINRVDPPQLPPLDLFGTSAELVDEFTNLKYT